MPTRDRDMTCDECGKPITRADGEIRLGNGKAYHHPRCHDAYRRRLNRRRDGETGRFE